MILWLVSAVALMVGIPWITVLFAGSAGMAICFILFFALDPVFSLLSGIFAGRNIQKRWFVPLANAGLFLLGTWLLFDAGEPAFLLYSGAYLVLGAAAMFLCALIRGKIKWKK